MQHILLIDNNRPRLSNLQNQLLVMQLNVSISHDFKQALKLLESDYFDIIVCAHSIDAFCMKTLSEQNMASAIIIVDENPQINTAVKVIKAGASDYLPSSATIKIITAIAQTSKKIQLQQQQQTTIPGMIGNCEAMQQIYLYINKAAPSDCNVLILGETGTGKELVAKAIHQRSNRPDKLLISVNCAAIPQTLIESELFGYEKGAFTGANATRKGLIEAANGGTLFLDEIGELPLEAQARLLRFIQEGEIRRIGSVVPRKVDVRLIVATHRDLKQLCSENLFREDLFYRINVMQLNLPPLRERGDDILDIANALLERCCQKFNYPCKQFCEQAILRIQEYDWPGNIRELENIIERAIIISDKTQLIINEELLPIDLNTSHVSNTSSNTQLTSANFIKAVSDNNSPSQTHTNKQNDNSLSLEDYFMSFVLKHQDSMSETELARKLGVSRKCLWERRQRLGIPRKKAPSSKSSSNQNA